MIAFYFYTFIGLVLGVYVMIEAKRLFTYREITLMESRGEALTKVPLSIDSFTKLAHQADDIDHGNAIIFQHRASNYVAIPLGKDEALISKVEEAA